MTAGALHALVERLSSTAATERLDLYLSLLLGVIERLIRIARDREGSDSGKSARSPSDSYRRESRSVGRSLGGDLARPRSEAARLNLDRSLLVLETLFRFQL